MPRIEEDGCLVCQLEFTRLLRTRKSLLEHKRRSIDPATPKGLGSSFSFIAGWTSSLYPVNGFSASIVRKFALKCLQDLPKTDTNYTHIQVLRRSSEYSKLLKENIICRLTREGRWFEFNHARMKRSWLATSATSPMQPPTRLASLY